MASLSLDRDYTKGQKVKWPSLAWVRHIEGYQVWFAAAILVGFVVLAVLAPYLGLPSPDDMDLYALVSPPSLSHPLGTDAYGRDILTRVLYGARVSLRVGLVSVALATLVGVPFGLLSGYYRGPVDSVLMRIVDAFLAFPPILLAVALIGILGTGETSVMIGLGIVYFPAFARVTRAKTLSVREMEFITAARAIGAKDLRILVRHLFPNVTGPILVQMTVAFAYAIIAEAGMSFLGLGTQPPTPSWGLMLAEARPYIEDAPWYPLIPGLVLSIVVLSITVVGDRLRALLDPKHR